MRAQGRPRNLDYKTPAEALNEHLVALSAELSADAGLGFAAARLRKTGHKISSNTDGDPTLLMQTGVATTG